MIFNKNHRFSLPRQRYCSICDPPMRFKLFCRRGVVGGILGGYYSLFQMHRLAITTMQKGCSMKIFILRKKWLVFAGMVLATVAMFTAVNLPTAITASTITKQLPIYSVERDQKMLSISFDAAWGDGRLR